VRAAAAAAVAAALVAGCGGPAELSDEEGRTLQSARERLDDALDTEETLRTDRTEARLIAREVRRRSSETVRLVRVVPSLVTLDRRVDQRALDAFLANATTDAAEALRLPATREAGRMTATLDDKDRQTKVEPLGQNADAYLAEAARDVRPIWPDLARRLERTRDGL
jgi:hypothetical protein